MARSFIEKIALTVFALTFLVGCGSSKVMTRQDYYTIAVGISTQDVISKYGEPYSIKNKKDGTQEYLYIERIPAGTETAEQNNYILVVKNGQVISKRTTQELPPAYDEIYDEDPNDVPN
jgi:hypothetical protein